MSFIDNKKQGKRVHFGQVTDYITFKNLNDLFIYLKLHNFIHLLLQNTYK